LHKIISLQNILHSANNILETQKRYYCRQHHILYTINNGEIGFDTSRYVYYLLENNIIYYLGIDLNEKDLVPYLFNR
jgi:hypothetical protein